jgi:hypothetical protein
LVGIGRVELADISILLGFLGLGGGVSNAFYSTARAKVKASELEAITAVVNDGDGVDAATAAEWLPIGK